MKKLILAIVVLFALLTPAFAATTNCTTTDDLVDERLDVKYDFAFYRIEAYRIGMDSIIDTLKLEGANTSELEDLNEKFLEKSSDLKDAETINDFNEIMHDLKGYVTDFRTDVNNLSANTDSLQEPLYNAMNDKETYLQGLLDSAYESTVNYQLDVFDASVCRLQLRIDAFEKLGYDMEKAQAKLDDYSDKRSDIEKKLNDAAEACNTTILSDCDASEVDDYEDLKDGISDDFIQVRAYVALVIADKSIEKTQDLIDKLDAKGVNVENFQETLDGMQDNIDSYFEDYNDDDFSSVETHIKNFRSEINDLRKDMRTAWKNYEGDD